MVLLCSSDAVMVKNSCIPPPGSVSVVSLVAAMVGIVSQRMFPLFVVAHINTTSCPTLTFCDCGVAIATALEEVIPTKVDKLTCMHTTTYKTKHLTSGRKQQANSIYVHDHQHSCDKLLEQITCTYHIHSYYVNFAMHASPDNTALLDIFVVLTKACQDCPETLVVKDVSMYVYNYSRYQFVHTAIHHYHYV